MSLSDIRACLRNTGKALLCVVGLSLGTFAVPIVSAQSSAPACSTNAADNGDGWGYEYNRSCRFTAGASNSSGGGGEQPECSPDAYDNGGGWGWENNQSCKWGNSTASTSSSNNSSGTLASDSYPLCTAYAIPSGDFGWENNQSCKKGTHPVCTAAATNSGGGYGWDNNQACKYGSGSTAATANSGSSGNTDSVATSGSTSSGTNVCSASAADNGNGWGFEYGESCKWGSVQPAGSNGSSGVAPPVSAANKGFQDGKPVCLTDSSDGNGDGFGYENDKTCMVVNGVTATPQKPLLNERWCQRWAEISYGDYVLQNNTWNNSDIYGNDWFQCITLAGGPGNYVAKWDYDWKSRNEGNEYAVKTYPQVYYGRKTKNTQSGTPAKLGLPANINQLPKFKVRFRYSETGNAERNVALESFFHTSCEAEEWNKHFELMVWVNKPAIRTPGPKVTEAMIDGRMWNVHTNPKLGWGYVAFVAQQPENEGWLDWNAFVDWTRNQGPGYGVWEIGNNCMGAIEMGTESWWGTGTFTLHEFRVTKQ